MAFSSLHVCMESSNSDHWLQGTIHEESGVGMESSPSPSPISCALSAGDHMNIIPCSSTRPMTERKLRPPQDQLALKCPRCDSTHTKFCYYNNYSLSQPRYFCKSCRRYWTKGGTLRNIPVGGTCRKNKKVSSKKSNNNDNNNNQSPIINNQINQNQAYPVGPSNYPSNNNFIDMQFSHHINNLLIGSSTNAGALMENPNNFMMESKYSNMGMLEGMIRNSSRNIDLGVGDVNVAYNNNNNYVLGSAYNYQGFCSSAFGGMSLVDGNNNIMDSCHQRMMLPCGDELQNSGLIDLKPNPRVLSLEWQDMMMQGHRSDGKDISGCIDAPRSWTGVINGYGSSTTNPLV